MLFIFTHMLCSFLKYSEQHEIELEDKEKRDAAELINIMRAKVLAVVRIQTIARGGISRERVKKIRMARWRGLQESLDAIPEENDGNQHKELKITRTIKGMALMSLLLMNRHALTMQTHRIAYRYQS